METRPDGTPARLYRHGKPQYVAEVIDSWRSCDRWWEGALGRTYHRVELKDRTHLVIYREDVTEQWFEALVVD